MMNKTIEKIPIELYESTDNAQVVYTTRRLAAQLGFDDVHQSLIATAASELSTNIIRYAGSGTITLKVIQRDNRSGIEIKAIDQGPGIADIKEALTDHFTTSNGLGLGLPSVRRIMDEFDIQSDSGGTQIIARTWKE